MANELCPGGFEACSLWDYKNGYKCAYARCKYWAGLRSEADAKAFFGEPQRRKANDLPWAESKVPSEDKPTAAKCPTCGRRHRKKKKAATNGPTPLEAYIEEQKKKESGRPFDDDLPW